MTVIDPGHLYALHQLDAEPEAFFILRFVKREGSKYPGNVGHYPGTNIQEVLRACLDRVLYLDAQHHHWTNQWVIRALRIALHYLEIRAAEIHGRPLLLPPLGEPIEHLPFCPKCGHIGCTEVA